MPTDPTRYNRYRPLLSVTRSGQNCRYERYTPLEGVTIVTLADLEEIAGRVQRLTIYRRDPERFFEDRSEIAHDIRKLARLPR